MDLSSVEDLPWDLLSEAERARAGAFRQEEDARTFCRTRAFLRRVLSGYLGVPPKSVRIAQSTNGKPHLPDSEGLTFNLSHSATAALLAVSVDQEIGIDVEDAQPLPDLEQVARDVLSAEEIRVVLAAEGHERLLRFLRAWTRKEAILKAMGKGLGVPLESFSVPLQADGCWTLSGHEIVGRWGRPVMVRDVSRDRLIAAVAGQDVSGRLVERTLSGVLGVNPHP